MDPKLKRIVHRMLQSKVKLLLGKQNFQHLCVISLDNSSEMIWLNIKEFIHWIFRGILLDSTPRCWQDQLKQQPQDCGFWGPNHKAIFNPDHLYIPLNQNVTFLKSLKILWSRNIQKLACTRIIVSRACFKRNSRENMRQSTVQKEQKTKFNPMWLAAENDKHHHLSPLTLISYKNQLQKKDKKWFSPSPQNAST